MKTLNNDGFTIVEALVALVVTTIVVLVLTNYMISGVQQSSLALAKDNINHEIQQSLDKTASDIRISANADQHNRWPDANSPGGSANQFGWQSNGSTLVLATAAKKPDNSIIFSDSLNYITEKNNVVYFVKNGTLYKRVIASPKSGNAAVTTCPTNLASVNCPADQALLNDVTAFEVTYLNGQNQTVAPADARSIELRLAVSKKVFGKPVAVDYKTRMVFRND